MFVNPGITPQNSNELIPKIAMFKGSYLFSKPSTPLHDTRVITLPPNTFGRVEEP